METLQCRVNESGISKVSQEQQHEAKGHGKNPQEGLRPLGPDGPGIGDVLLFGKHISVLLQGCKPFETHNHSNDEGTYMILGKHRGSAHCTVLLISTHKCSWRLFEHRCAHSSH